MRSRMGMLAASAAAFGAVGTGTALAQDTAAGTSVSNTFTLDYQVGGVSQAQISNGASPTTFVVDRKVDLTVTAGASTASGTPNGSQALSFTVANTGNDDFRYALALDVATPSGETGIVGLTAAAYTVTYYPPSASGACTGTATVYTVGATIADVPAGQSICVSVSSTLSALASDGQQSLVSLVATAVSPADWAVDTTPVVVGTALVADTSNTMGDVDVVFADADGDGASGTLDAETNAKHVAGTTITVTSASLAGSKDVYVVSTDGTACNPTDSPVNDTTVAAWPTTEFPVPGACVAYAIRVENTGSTSASGILIKDPLPAQVTWVGEAVTGALSGGSFTKPGAETGTQCTSGSPASCTVFYDGGSVANGASGRVVIYATVN